MKAVEPRGAARPEWETLHELVFNVTGQNGFVSIEGLFNQMAKEIPALAGFTWAALGDTGVTIQI
jgi:predicted molibdopterin-dependent oxidoreductase YjgC